MSTFAASCRQHEIETADPALFVDHMKVAHGIKSWEDNQFGRLVVAPKWVRDAGKPWKLHNTRKPFEPKPFDVGDQVVFVLGSNPPAVLRGQVWSGSVSPRSRWIVADGIAYDVHESQQVALWLDAERRGHWLACRRHYGWQKGEWKERARRIRLGIREVEHQLERLSS